MRTRKLIPLSEDFVKRVAYIMGDSSAAARALVDAEVRRAYGETVAFYQEGHAILVGPNHEAAE